MAETLDFGESRFLAADCIHTCSSAVQSFCVAQGEKYKFWHRDYPVGSKVGFYSVSDQLTLFLLQDWSTTPCGRQGLPELVLLYMIKFVHLCLLA